jgi:hypothetical protein
LEVRIMRWHGFSVERLGDPTPVIYRFGFFRATRYGWGGLDVDVFGGYLCIHWYRKGERARVYWSRDATPP